MSSNLCRNLCNCHGQWNYLGGTCTKLDSLEVSNCLSYVTYHYYYYRYFRTTRPCWFEECRWLSNPRHLRKKKNSCMAAGEKALGGRGEYIRGEGDLNSATSTPAQTTEVRPAPYKEYFLLIITWLAYDLEYRRHRTRLRIDSIQTFSKELAKLVIISGIYSSLGGLLDVILRAMLTFKNCNVSGCQKQRAHTILVKFCVFKPKYFVEHGAPMYRDSLIVPSPFNIRSWTLCILSERWSAHDSFTTVACYSPSCISEVQSVKLPSRSCIINVPSVY